MDNSELARLNIEISVSDATLAYVRIGTHCEIQRHRERIEGSPEELQKLLEKGKEKV